MAVDTSQFRNGLRIVIDGEPLVMTYFQHVKPGKGGAFVRTKLKNLRTGRTKDQTFRSGEKVEEADVEWLEANGFRVDSVMSELLVRGWLESSESSALIAKDPRIARVQPQMR